MRGMPRNSRTFCPLGDPSRAPIVLPVEIVASDRRPRLHFSLRHLFWAVTAVSLLLAAVTRFPGGYGSIAFLLALAVMVLHLMSTAVGTRLRAETDKQTGVFRPVAARTRDSANSSEVSATGESNSLLRRRGFAMPWLPMLVAAGAIAGGCLGIAILELTIGHLSTTTGVLVGAVSAAVLGGWFAFLGGCFTSILRQGWRDAVADGK
jgi:hypothetical protein